MAFWSEKPDVWSQESVQLASPPSGLWPCQSTELYQGPLYFFFMNESIIFLPEVFLILLPVLVEMPPSKLVLKSSCH